MLIMIISVILEMEVVSVYRILKPCMTHACLSLAYFTFFAIFVLILLVILRIKQNFYYKTEVTKENKTT